MYSCREEVSESTTKHFLSRCAYISSAWGCVWLGCIHCFGGLVSCDEWETLCHCCTQDWDWISPNLFNRSDFHTQNPQKVAMTLVLCCQSSCNHSWCYIHIILLFNLALWSQRGFQTSHCQTEWVVFAEPRNSQDPWLKRLMAPMLNMQMSPNLVFFSVVLAATLAALFSASIWEVVLKDLPSVTKWHPSLLNPCISCEWRVLCILPRATNRCILQLHAPSCLHSDPFVWRRCYSKVGTPAEFKWGSPEWSNAGKLAGGSSFHGLTVPSVNVNISVLCKLRPAVRGLGGRVINKQTKVKQDRLYFLWSFILTGIVLLNLAPHCQRKSEFVLWFFFLLALWAVRHYSGWHVG